MRVQKYLPGEAPSKEIAWTVRVQGNCVHVSKTGGFPRKRPPREHGPVNGYSPQARMRALRTVARIDWAALRPSIFVTLGYPDSAIEWSYEVRAKQLDLFRRGVERHLAKKVPIFWRWEWESRKSGRYRGYLAPHVHLMILRTRYLCKDVIRSIWSRVIGVSEFVHTDVRKIYGADGAGRYLTSYIAKARSLGIVTKPDGTLPDGRSWGLLRRSLFSWHGEYEYPGVPESEVEWLKRVAYASLPWYGKHGEFGFTLLSEALAAEFRQRYFSGLDVA